MAKRGEKISRRNVVKIGGLAAASLVVGCGDDDSAQDLDASMADIPTPDVSALDGGLDARQQVDGAMADGGPTNCDATIGISQSDSRIVQYDSVRFVASGWEGFDTPEEHLPSGNIYKPRFHDIVYFWDTGRTGDFSAPTNVLPEHKSRRYAHGPVVMVCYDEPGTYNIRLYAFELTSGKCGVATTTVTVTDADIEYPGPQTICINPNGDDDFSDAPDGAQTIVLEPGNVFDEDSAPWTENLGGDKKRFLFKGDATFATRLRNSDLNAITSGIMFSSYGLGSATLTEGGFGLGAGDFDTETRVLVNNLRFQGTFNPTTSEGGPSQVMGVGGRIHLVVHKLEIDGYGGTVFFLTASDLSVPVYHHFDDVVMTNIGGQYPLLAAGFRGAESYMGVSGCRIVRAPESDFNEGYSGMDGEQRAPVRINGHMWVHMQANDIFQNTGNQPCLKLAESGLPGGVHNVCRNSFECAHGSVLKYQDQDSGNHTNLIWRHNVMLLGPVHSGFSFAGLIGGQGCSVDGNLLIALGSAGRVEAQQRGAFRFQATGDASATPNYVRNNTFVHYKDAVENTSDNIALVVVSSGDYDIVQGCNLDHFIGIGLTPYMPLEDDGTPLFVTRNTGRWLAGAFDVDYRNRPAEVYSFRPRASSPANGARTNEAYFPLPIDGQTELDLRGESVNFGAW